MVVMEILLVWGFIRACVFLVELIFLEWVSHRTKHVRMEDW